MSSVRKRSLGNPAFRNSSSSAIAHSGTFAACLSTAPFPAMSAGAAKRITCQKGKFHGMIASTTPSGWNVTNDFDASVGMTSRARNRSAFVL